MEDETVHAESLAHQIGTQVLTYLAALDSAIDTLSTRTEGSISSLPEWMLSPRHISVGVNSDCSLAVVRIVPEPDSTKDILEAVEMITDDDLRRVIAPIAPGFPLRGIQHPGFFQVADLQLHEVGSPLEPALLHQPGIWSFGNPESALKAFNDQIGREDAINFWNKTSLMSGGSRESIVDQMRTVFRTFQKIIKLKSFRERRIHRFLNSHAKLLLPPHQRSWFEIPFRLGDDVRRADFVLQREQGMPGLLIELENPAVKVFRKNGELTAEANHACNQIAEWVKFIDRDAATNAAGEFSFLIGPKQRLVVIGRGMEHVEEMLNSRFTDTVIWTYDFLLQQAKERWDSTINHQRSLIGLPPQALFI
jgi:hypothetical protein